MSSNNSPSSSDSSPGPSQPLNRPVVQSGSAPGSRTALGRITNAEGETSPPPPTLPEAVHNEQNRSPPPTTMPPARGLAPPPRVRRRPHLRRRPRIAVVQEGAPEVINHQQQPDLRGQGELNNNNPAEPPPPPPQPVGEPPAMMPPDEFNDAELRVIKDVADYLFVPIAKSSLYLVIIAWCLLYYPTLSASSVVNDTIMALLFVGLGTKAVADVVRRPDIRIFGPFHSFEIRIAQLMTVALVCILLDTIMNPLGYALGLLYFNLQDATTFQKQVEEVRKKSLQDYFQTPPLWFHVNLHFLIVGFAILFAIDILATFHRMSRRNVAVMEILIYEFYAYFYPVGFILLPFFVLNCVAAFVPISAQSIWFLWTPLHILSAVWIGIVLLGVAYYPEIPIRRPMGLPGYMYMEQVILTQIGIGGCAHGLFCLLRAIYFQLIPGSRMASLESAGIVTGSSEYFTKLAEGKDEIMTEYPYPPSYELVQGIFFIIFLIRYLKLRMSFEEIQERIDREIRAPVF